MKLTGTNLFVLAKIADGTIHFQMRRGRLCVEAIHASHVHRLVAAGCLAVDGTITEFGRTELAAHEIDAERWYVRRRELEVALAAVATNMVTILGVDDPKASSLGTGFLVTVGGRVFVFTAGHNRADALPLTTAVRTRPLRRRPAGR